LTRLSSALPTPEALQAEWLRRGPLAWSRRYATLPHPTLGILRFGQVMRDYQRDLLDDSADRIIIVKARQIGISQTLAFRAAHEALRGGTVLVVSRTGEQAGLFLKYVYTALAEAPHPPYARENQGTLEFAGRGAVYTQAASKGAGRGIPASLVILDEMAWMEYGDDIFTSIMPTLSNGGTCIVCSTPYGRANKFYQLWAGGDETWSRHNLPWNKREDWAADPTWADTKRDEIGREAFAQEYDCDFAVSGGAVFDEADIVAAFCLPPMPSATGNFALSAERGHWYVTSWDIGRVNDATVGITIDRTTKPYRIVAFERSLHADYPVTQAAIERRAATYPGTTIVESNGVGDPVIQNLRIKVTPFVTTARTKKDAIDAASLVLQRRDVQSPPIPALQRELQLYQREDKGLVQDSVMSLAFGCYELLRGRPFTWAAGPALPKIEIR
jgi:hypothetical protein